VGDFVYDRKESKSENPGETLAEAGLSLLNRER